MEKTELINEFVKRIKEELPLEYNRFGMAGNYHVHRAAEKIAEDLRSELIKEDSGDDGERN